LTSETTDEAAEVERCDSRGLRNQGIKFNTEAMSLLFGTPRPSENIDTNLISTPNPLVSIDSRAGQTILRGERNNARADLQIPMYDTVKM